MKDLRKKSQQACFKHDQGLQQLCFCIFFWHVFISVTALPGGQEAGGPSRSLRCPAHLLPHLQSHRWSHPPLLPVHPKTVGEAFQNHFVMTLLQIPELADMPVTAADFTLMLTYNDAYVSQDSLKSIVTCVSIVIFFQNYKHLLTKY